LDEYYKDLDSLLNYLPEAERNKYLEKRTAELQTRLRRTQEEIPEKEYEIIQETIGLAMKSSDKDIIDDLAKHLKRRLKKSVKS
jgi:hypothetical protein